MKREKMLSEMNQNMHNWDVIIIGGGATGLGAAVDAASRGYRTLLVEQHDFAKATSSRSTKLIHGGLRYLQQGNVSLVVEALKERGLLCKNAPHLVHHLPFLVPTYHWWEGPFYGIGLKVYDILAGSLGIEKSYTLSKEETLEKIPTLDSKDLRGGAIYYDGQFDDARLAITLAKTAANHGAVLINYMKVVGLVKKHDLIVGVKLIDQEKNEIYEVHGKSVINATGIFSDEVRHLDNPKLKPIIAPSQGVHLVLPKSFQPNDTALLVPHTEDNRVLFLVPWHDRVLLGTTDTAVKQVNLEPAAQDDEIEFLLKHAAKYLHKAPTRGDVMSVYAGLRPLVKSGDGENTPTLSRDHMIFISPSGLITITGGKWTTYRKMAEDVINKAIIIGNLPEKECITKNLKLSGYKETSTLINHWSLYGSEAESLNHLIHHQKELSEKLHPNLPYLWAEVLWAIREEMARSVEDVLARRTRSLLLDAKASMEVAPKVAEMLARELHKDKTWEQKQVGDYYNIAQRYIV